MKTLKEHNEQRLEAFRQMEEQRKPHPNGIACPKCGDEMWDSDPMMTFTSNPPQKSVHCPGCGHADYRIA